MERGLDANAPPRRAQTGLGGYSGALPGAAAALRVVGRQPSTAMMRRIDPRELKQTFWTRIKGKAKIAFSTSTLKPSPSTPSKSTSTGPCRSAKCSQSTTESTPLDMSSLINQHSSHAEREQPKVSKVEYRSPYTPARARTLRMLRKHASLASLADDGDEIGNGLNNAAQQLYTGDNNCDDPVIKGNDITYNQTIHQMENPYHQSTVLGSREPSIKPLEPITSTNLEYLPPTATLSFEHGKPQRQATVDKPSLPNIDELAVPLSVQRMSSAWRPLVSVDQTIFPTRRSSLVDSRRREIKGLGEKPSILALTVAEMATKSARSNSPNTSSSAGSRSSAALQLAKVIDESLKMLDWDVDLALKTMPPVKITSVQQKPNTFQGHASVVQPGANTLAPLELETEDDAWEDIPETSNEPQSSVLVIQFEEEGERISAESQPKTFELMLKGNTGRAGGKTFKKESNNTTVARQLLAVAIKAYGI
ncbi:hypothetical protein HDV05_002214 [Chytridiales sp. JEL 0842]|nr:hypothetical protein HDV05_002214 [Chytridiales sp. JEL 0842]